MLEARRAHGRSRGSPAVSRRGPPGAYLRIVEEGELGAGDAVEIVDRPDHDLTIGDVERVYHVDRDRVRRLLDVPELSEGWRVWARKRVA